MDLRCTWVDLGWILGISRWILGVSGWILGGALQVRGGLEVLKMAENLETLCFTFLLPFYPVISAFRALSRMPYDRS